MINQSLSWWCYARPGVDAAGLLRAAAAMGYRGVDLVGQEHWAAVRDHGLVIAAVGGHQSLTDGLNKRANHGRIEDEIRANLDLAVEWQIPNLICFSGNRDGIGDEEGAEATAEGLRRVAGRAEQAGVNLVVELLNSKVDHQDYQCDRTPWGVKVCDMVSSPRVRLLYDIYHMQIMEGDVIRTIRDYGSYFAHYHTAGVPGRRDMDETQELYYPAIMRAIAETGYRGYVGHEFVPKGDVVQALQAAYALCDV